MKWSRRNSKIKVSSDDSIVEQIAKVRGITDVEDFLNPSKDNYISPYKLMNSKEVADRIISALMNEEKIAISADVDFDGCSSTATMFRYLSNFTNNLYIVTHEREDGHGVEHQIESIDSDTNLLIILDSSTNSVEACKKIKEMGIDIVIIDHHEVEVEENPYALVVNPQMDDYPNKDLSACGLTYKIIEIMDDRLGTGDIEKYLDLVAFALVADVMSMTSKENRYLMSVGLKNINNLGLKAIMASKNISFDKVNCQTIAYNVTPLINSVTRMNNIKLAINLLIEDDSDHCLELLKQANKLNEERRNKERELYEIYLQQVDENDKIIVVTDTHASTSFNGLVANKLAQQFQRPAIVMRSHSGSLAGSFRSIGGFDLKSFLNTIPVVEYSLGHSGAGAIKMREKDLETFKQQVDEKLKGLRVTFEDKLEYDIEIDANEINTQLIKQLEEINLITGKNFPVVRVLVKNAFVENRYTFGKTSTHVKIECDGFSIIKFNVDENYASELKVFDEIDVIGTLNINEWFSFRDKKTLITNQLFLDDYKLIK